MKKRLIYAIMTSNDRDEHENRLAIVLFELLIHNSDKHVSLIFGGFTGVVQDAEKSKAKVVLHKKEPGFFKKLFNLFS